MPEISAKELAAMEAACHRVANWPEPERDEMIESAKDVIGGYYLEERIDAEIRDRLYKILSNPTV